MSLASSALRSDPERRVVDGPLVTDDDLREGLAVAIAVAREQRLIGAIVHNYTRGARKVGPLRSSGPVRSRTSCRTRVDEHVAQVRLEAGQPQLALRRQQALLRLQQHAEPGAGDVLERAAVQRDVPSTGRETPAPPAPARRPAGRSRPPCRPAPCDQLRTSPSPVPVAWRRAAMPRSHPDRGLAAPAFRFVLVFDAVRHPPDQCSPSLPVVRCSIGAVDRRLPATSRDIERRDIVIDQRHLDALVDRHRCRSPPPLAAGPVLDHVREQFLHHEIDRRQQLVVDLQPRERLGGERDQCGKRVEASGRRSPARPPNRASPATAVMSSCCGVPPAKSSTRSQQRGRSVRHRLRRAARARCPRTRSSPNSRRAGSTARRSRRTAARGCRPAACRARSPAAATQAASRPAGSWWACGGPSAGRRHEWRIGPCPPLWKRSRASPGRAGRRTR